jgi:hypothetical protein
MLVCGEEEPIRASEYIDLYEKVVPAEGDDTLYVNDYEDPRLNRYSFVWLGQKSESSKVFSGLLNVILSQTGLQATWIEAYRTDTLDRIRSMYLIKKRAREGWHVQAGEHLAKEELTVAVSPPSDSVSESLRPSYEQPTSGLQNDSFLLFLGKPPTPTELVSEPLRVSILRFSAGGRMVPGRFFLDWLARTRSTIVYKADADGGHRGLIIVGPVLLSTRQLFSQGIIQETKEGEMAGKVWAYPPTLDNRGPNK